MQIHFSIYYSAERIQAITDAEKKNVESIVNRYNTEYPFKRKTEDFCVYDSIDDENIIFSGAENCREAAIRQCMLLPGTG